jgi:hypothetical protein
MAVQRAPGPEDGRRLNYRCKSSVGTLIGIGTLRQTRGLDAKPLMDADVCKGTRLTSMLPPSRGFFFKASRIRLDNVSIRREEEVESARS